MLTSTFNSKQIFIILSLMLFVLVAYMTYGPYYMLDIDRVQLFYGINFFLDTGRIPSHGLLNSQMLYNPPHHVWLYIIPGLISRHPSISLIPGLIIQLGALFAIFWICTKYFSFEAGLIASLLYQFTNLGQYLGGTSWAQGLIPGLLILFLYFILQWIQENKSAYIFPSLLILSLMVGIHLSAILLIPILGILFLVYRPLINIKALILALLSIVILWSPYLYFELDRDFIDVLGVLDQNLRQEVSGIESNFCDFTEYGETTAVEMEADYILRLKRLIVAFYRKVRGIIASIGSNFSFRESTNQLHLIKSGILKCLAWLSLFAGIYKASQDNKVLRIICFVLMALIVLQNMTSFNTLNRPDITWMYYGIQIILIAILLCDLSYFKHFVVRATIYLFIFIHIATAIFSPPSRIFAPLQNLSAYQNAEINAQQEIVEWVINTAPDDKVINIAYDFLQDIPERCWVVVYGQFDPNYYIGSEFDYWFSLYQVENSSLAIDGLSIDADFVILDISGLDRYADYMTQFANDYFAVIKLKE